jgi:hypothetical protein
MSAATTETVAAFESPSGSPLHRFVWHCRHNPKRELWFAWWAMVTFYNLYVVSVFVLAHAQPPPSPAWDAARVAQWFTDNHHGILVGFGINFLVTGLLIAPTNGLIAYSMLRMSVSRVFAYSYLVMYALSALPGMLLMCIVLTVGAMRPDRDPELTYWLYDLAFLSFTGTMGVFLLGSLVWMVAILLDKNRVFPKWFAYLNLANALTEVVVAPAWIFKNHVFSWNGVIAWWVDMVVFAVYTGVFIMLLRKMIEREDFGAGPLPGPPPGSLPEPAPSEEYDPSELARTTR